jgi:hypothetical protein
VTIASLFEVPLEEFTAARNALSRKLHDSGNVEEAKRIGGLRKPSKALWLINQLTRRAPRELQALIDATRRIRNAQQKGLAGDEVREAMREQRAALGALTALAEPALQRRVHDTLQAAAMAEPEALREGRLERELPPAGFEALLASGVSALQHQPPKKVSAPKAAAKVDDKKHERELLAAEKEAKKLAAHAAALEAEAAKADAAAAKADAAAAGSRAAASAAEAAAAKAREAATKAGEEARAARGQASTAEAQARELREQ